MPYNKGNFMRSNISKQFKKLLDNNFKWIKYF